MKTAAELRAEIAALGVSYRAIEDKAKSENREVTAAEGAEIDRLFASKEKLDAELVEAVKVEARRQQAATAFAGSAPATARTAGDRNPANTAGFRDIGEFARAVHAAHPQVGGGLDPRLNQLAPPAEYHREGGSTDGYLVPTDFRNGIWNAVDEAGDILALVNAETTSGNQVSMLKDETTPWGAAGIEAHWTAEGAKLKASQMEVGSVDVKLHKLVVMALSTEELIQDAPNFASRVESKASLAIAWKLSNAILYGSGVGQPLGFFGSKATVTVAKEPGQAAGTINDQNILKMYSRLLMMGGSNPVWLANSDTLPQLGALKIGDNAAWLPIDQPLAGRPQGTLLGQPLLWTEHAKTVGEVGDLALVNMSGYAAYRKAGTRHDTSIHLYFDYDMKAFRWIVRFGGRPVLSAPIAPANGANTKSHFVTLAKRA